MSKAALQERDPHSSSFVSSKVIKFVTLCGYDYIDDELYDIDDDNNLGYHNDKEDTDYTNEETVDDDDYLESHLKPCKMVNPSPSSWW